jgi:2'-5' RNA ligase
MGETVEELWADIAARWGLRPAHRGVRPHLTLVTVRDGMPPLLRPRLASIAATTAPFRVTGAGYGLFVGHGPESLVVHLTLTRRPPLSALHGSVCAAVADSGAVIDGQTDPGCWSPHVTLADAGLGPALVGRIMGHLAERGPRHWTADVDNLCVITATGRTAWVTDLTGGR